MTGETKGIIMTGKGIIMTGVIKGIIMTGETKGIIMTGETKGIIMTREITAKLQLKEIIEDELYSLGTGIKAHSSTEVAVQSGQDWHEITY